ncbi:lysine 2,3-aminomutase [Thioclava dalianensis]|uniref:Lysine 2,3-aminomutase n=1 Tax=Thioclava dalianensis TaxID=1185766 RepID=A0A074TB39_9RHOB|nr:lysine-2,3-aminomutase-like protein [Thioclava dalianensis]KEP69001.1 lysine 2,3-aminomutase [Thioclava dalianensis]SFM88331.1 lysine 2,3-aminomutase [Thioclava dalianensis]
MTDHSPPARALTRVTDLERSGLTEPQGRADLERVAQEFRIRVTPEMRGAISTPADPVAAQFVPSAHELHIRPEELGDPIGDDAHSPVPGLTHRYPDRVILHITKTCDVYCRFCFRRETVGEIGPLPEAQLDAALEYIAATPAIREVILTGGDPLTLSPRRLGAVLDRLGAIAHLDQIRLHTRVPVVAPERITEALCERLRAAPTVWIVLHTNVAQELTEAARGAIARLVDHGIPLLSQTVLLRGVNADPDTLEALMRALTALRVKPYYLHHCDLARGTSHFRTTLAEGRAVMAELARRCSGTMIPRYVLDIPGGFGKVEITADHVAPTGTAGQWRITDRQGRVHDYADPSRIFDPE